MSTTLTTRLGLPRRPIQILISVGLVIPIFFQLNTGIFLNKTTVFDSQGSLATTPLPLSIISCLVGLLLLTDIRRAKLPILITILSLALFLVSFFLSALLNNSSLQVSKLTLLAQFFVPLLGLVLGFSWDSSSQNSTEDSTVFQSTTIVLSSFLIAVQLLATVFQKAHPLTPWMYFFSIYQHLQYVPVLSSLIDHGSAGYLWPQLFLYPVTPCSQCLCKRAFFAAWVR